MTLMEMLRQAGIVALLSMVVGLFPLVFGVAYAIRPSEHRLAVMRPTSLAAIFAGLCGMLSAFVMILRSIAATENPIPFRRVALGVSEALVPLYLVFGCLMVAWLCVAVGLARRP
jgi:hypothetical protein